MGSLKSSTAAVGAAVGLAAALVITSIAGTVSVAGPTRQVRYVGVHPIPKSEGGGICYIEGPHVHIYDADKLQYREVGNAHYFIGDPVAYGYDGKRFAYKGAHPIHVAAEVDADAVAPVLAPGAAPIAPPPLDDVYCYIEGPHFHYFAPPDGPDFKRAGDVYFYVGEPPKVFVDARPAMVKINAIYTPLVYDRPVIAVDAPVGWIGARAEFAAPALAVEAPAAVGVGAAVVVPGISVRAVMPSVHIGIGVGASVGVGAGVRVGHGHH